jgi:carboxypeptidase C (cathepsin A)
VLTTHARVARYAIRRFVMTVSGMPRLIGLLVITGLAMPPLNAEADTSGTQGPSEPVMSSVTTHHWTHIHGARLPYSATVAETQLVNPLGRPVATIFSTSYVRDDTTDHARRPVLFLFNGGPGASSSPLHLAFGPVTLSQAVDAGGIVKGASREIAENPNSVLDVADLVFIDPVGTGFARVLPAGDGTPYWTSSGDAESMLAFIRGWSRKNDRAMSPKLICGESYGGFRLATMLNDANDLQLSGALFVSPALDMTISTAAPGNDLAYIMTLPTMAADAWYHRRVKRNGRSLEDTFRSALRFAETEYASALLQGSRLPTATRLKIAGRIAETIGVSTQFVLERDLRIPIQDFVTGLLTTSGLRIGRTDGRNTGVDAVLSKNTPPFDDPAISPGGSASGLLEDYFRSDLKFVTQRPYMTLAIDVNSKWVWPTMTYESGFYLNTTPGIAKALHDNPRLKILVVGGYFDLATPAAATVYAIDHANLPEGRVTEIFYESGHSIYQNASSHAKLSTDMRAFIQSSIQ